MAMGKANLCWRSFLSRGAYGALVRAGDRAYRAFNRIVSHSGAFRIESRLKKGDPPGEHRSVMRLLCKITRSLRKRGLAGTVVTCVRSLPELVPQRRSVYW